MGVLYTRLREMSSNFGCEFGNVTVGQAQQVLSEALVAISAFGVHDPTNGRLGILSTSGHQVIHASLEASSGFTFSKGALELLLADDQLESFEFSQEHFLGPVEGIHVARTEAMSVLVHVPVNTLELFGAGHFVGHLESFLLCDGAIIPEPIDPVTTYSCDLELFGNHLSGRSLDLNQTMIGQLSKASKANRSHQNTKNHTNYKLHFIPHYQKNHNPHPYRSPQRPWPKRGHRP